MKKANGAALPLPALSSIPLFRRRQRRATAPTTMPPDPGAMPSTSMPAPPRPRPPLPASRRSLAPTRPPAPTLGIGQRRQPLPVASARRAPANNKGRTAPPRHTQADDASLDWDDEAGAGLGEAGGSGGALSSLAASVPAAATPPASADWAGIGGATTPA